MKILKNTTSWYRLNGLGFSLLQMLIIREWFFYGLYELVVWSSNLWSVLKLELTLRQKKLSLEKNSVFRGSETKSMTLNHNHRFLKLTEITLTITPSIHPLNKTLQITFISGFINYIHITSVITWSMYCRWCSNTFINVSAV